MGTYTTNYNLFMPTVGETGWGELVNGNFATIDTAMKGLNTRLTTCENALGGRHYTVTQGSTVISFSNVNIYGGQMSFTLLYSLHDTYSGTISASATGAGNNAKYVRVYGYNLYTGGYVQSSGTLTFSNVNVIMVTASRNADSTSNTNGITFNNLILTPS